MFRLWRTGGGSGRRRRYTEALQRMPLETFTALWFRHDVHTWSVRTGWWRMCLHCCLAKKLKIM